jgi:hypothetical protein
MILTCDVLALTTEDITEGMLEGHVLDIPRGARRLMMKADAIEYFNDALGFTDAAPSDDPPEEAAS